jgi:hypothetical protein
MSNQSWASTQFLEYEYRTPSTSTSTSTDLRVRLRVRVLSAELSIFAINALAFLFLNVLYIILSSVKFCNEWYRIVELFLLMVREKGFYENRVRSIFAYKSTGNNHIFGYNSGRSRLIILILQAATTGFDLA